MGKKGLEEFLLWVRAKDLTVMVCKEVVAALPVVEKFCLGSQMRRSAQSVPANIAEAYGRYHYRDSIRFCYIARGSLEETLSHLIVARELGYIQEGVFEVHRGAIREVGRMLNGYIGYLARWERTHREGQGMQVAGPDS